MSDHTSPPREPIIRAFAPGLEFRAADDTDDALEDGQLGILRVLFSPVNEWTEINSMWEGRFMERFAPRAWKKTIREQAHKVRSLFQHGMDPQVGDKPLGPIRALEENDEGGYGEVVLLDTSYNRDILPGLKEGLYGASHRFRTMREEWVEKPEASEQNPEGLPERTIKEAHLMEFGPVTFPAYEGATATVRSMTDQFLMEYMRADPARLRGMFDKAVDLSGPAEEQDEQDAPSTDDAAATDVAAPLPDERRETTPAPRKPVRPIYGMSRKETSQPWRLGPSKSTKRT